MIAATDDARIAEAVAAFGGRAVMTSSDHTSGTDRIAEALAGIDTRIAVNVQGDELLIEPATIAAAAAPLLEDRGVCMSTAPHLDPQRRRALRSQLRQGDLQH